MHNTNIEYIGAGNFFIAGRQNLIIKALLSTCVGVVIFDRTVNVGGLLHLILPEPLNIGNPWQPESYASTGLPLFIEKLREAGAKTKSMEAYIAGGALIGKVLERDINMDIGGRTVDVVMNILSREAIQIKKSQTGGVFNMALSLNINTWECNIETLIQHPLPAKSEIKKPTMEEIDRTIARLRPIPQVALKIVRMIGNDSYNILDVATEVRQDQVIAGKVLKLCNSVVIGWSKHIDSVDEALMAIGEKSLLRLVVSAGTELFFSESERGYSQCKGQLYHHAVGTALVAEKIALISGKSDPAITYTAGLLHDIGKVVLDRLVARNLPLFYDRTRKDIIDFEEAEVEILGIGHAEVGGRLASLWSIPQNLIEAIMYHHQPEKTLNEPELAHIVYLANLIASKFWVTQGLGRQNADSLSSCLKKLGLNSSHLPNIVDTITWDVINNQNP